MSRDSGSAGYHEPWHTGGTLKGEKRERSGADQNTKSVDASVVIASGLCWFSRFPLLIILWSWVRVPAGPPKALGERALRQLFLAVLTIWCGEAYAVLPGAPPKPV